MFIVLECNSGPEYTNIVVDENGNNKVFTSEMEAQIEAEQCQVGKVVRIY